MFSKNILSNKIAIFVILMTAVTLIPLADQMGTSYAQKYSELFKQQQSKPDHPCLISGDPNMGSSVVQLRSDPEEEGKTTDDCLAYIDELIESNGYKMFSVTPWGDDEYTWTLN